MFESGVPTYRVIHAFDDQRTAQLMDLYRGEWWTHDRTLAQTREMLKWSDLVIGLCDEANDRLVAFARVLTDRVFRAFIFDVIVAADHRTRGLGQRLMQELLAHPSLSGAELVELYCRPELVPFYERLGFTAPDSGAVLMRRRRGDTHNGAPDPHQPT